jgi:tetratricopeptide (TPR) repeat protein
VSHEKNACFLACGADCRTGSVHAARSCSRGLFRWVPRFRRARWLAAGCLLAGLAGLPAEASDALEEAASLRAAGRLDEALDALRKESREIKRLDGDDSPRLLPVNDLAAEVLIDQGSLEAAQGLLEKTIEAREKLIGTGRSDEAARLGDSLLSMTRLHLLAKRFSEAGATARKALLTVDAAVGPNSPETARAQAALEGVVDSLETLLGPAEPATLDAREEAARVFESLGMVGAAIRQRRGMLAGRRVPGQDAVALVSAEERFAELLLAAGRADEAIPLLENLLGRGSDLDAASRVALLRLLGALQLSTDQLIGAEATLEDVLKATGAAAGLPTVRSAADRCRRAIAALRRGSVQVPPDWLEPTLVMLGKTSSSEAAPGVAGLVAAAELLHTAGQAAAAVGPLARALAVAGATRPPLEEQVADVAGRLAAAQLETDDTAAANKTVVAHLAAAEKALGPGDPRVSTLRVMLVDVLRREGKLEEAEKLARGTLTRGLPRPDDRWEERFVGVYDSLADESRTNDLREAFVAARSRQFGDDHPHVGLAWAFFGSARVAAGDWSRAAECFNQALNIQSAALGEDDPEVAATLALLAHAQRAGGALNEAVETATRAVRAWEKASGPDHPGTLEAIDVLTAAQLQAGQATGVVELLERLCDAPMTDPVRRAGHLVRLAELTAVRDKAGAAERLRLATSLPCWKPDASLSASERLRLASTAARASRVLRVIGDPSSSQEWLRKARSLALQTPDPAALLDVIEQLATGTGEAKPAAD